MEIGCNSESNFDTYNGKFIIIGVCFIRVDRLFYKI